MTHYKTRCVSTERATRDIDKIINNIMQLHLEAARAARLGNTVCLQPSYLPYGVGFTTAFLHYFRECRKMRGRKYVKLRYRRQASDHQTNNVLFIMLMISVVWALKFFSKYIFFTLCGDGGRSGRGDAGDTGSRRAARYGSA